MIPVTTPTQVFKLFILAISVSLLASCGQASQQAEDNSQAESMVQQEMEPEAVVEVKAVGLTLVAQDEISPGWTTFRFINETDMIHLTFLYKIPDGKSIADHKELAAVFQNFMDDINQRPRSEPEAGDEIPEWFGEVVQYGGPGLLSPRKTGETTIYMDPGTYLIECYVKTDGIFHSYTSSPTQYGMVHEFTVTGEENQLEPPIPTINVDISSETGYTLSGEYTAGSHVVGVSFTDQTPHENFQGHDIHLFRINQDTDLSNVIKWMDWREPTGIQTPSPAEFLGGTNELPAGGQAYFKVDLEPGHYAWIAEVPNADEKGMLVEFEVAGSE